LCEWFGHRGGSSRQVDRAAAPSGMRIIDSDIDRVRGA
jgi:hypothetical protein